MDPVEAGLVPFDGRPFRWRVGARPLDVGQDWLQVDDRRGPELALRRELVRDRPAAVMAHLEGADVEAAMAELDEAVAAWLVDHDIAPAPSVRGVPVIGRTGLRAQEDWCLLVDRGAGPVLAAGVVCFPTVWRLAEKLGGDLAAVHGPVPGYEDALAEATDALLRRLGPGEARWRANWNLLPSGSLHLPDPPPEPDWASVDVGRRLWLRVERQTLRRLPRTGAVAFSIRIHQQRLDRLAGGPEALERLGAAVAALPGEVRVYKRLERLVEPLQAWISGVVQNSRSSPASAPRSSS